MYRCIIHKQVLYKQLVFAWYLLLQYSNNIICRHILRFRDYRFFSRRRVTILNIKTSKCFGTYKYPI